MTVRGDMIKEYQQRTARVALDLVAEGVYRLRLGRANAYIVVRGSSVVLVDTGLPTHAKDIERLLSELGIGSGGLDAILLTHRHLDHAGSAERLRQRFDSRVIVHRADAEAVQGRARLSPVRGLVGLPLGALVSLMDRRVFRYQPCQQLTAVEDGFQLDADFRLVHLPGHTPGHSGWHYAPADVIFCGDAARNTGGRLDGPSRLFTVDPVRMRSSLRTLAALDAQVYCFGHGRPRAKGAAALLRLSQGR
jgi:glyoxylase-like metal-dependent hydrolase (beta-lactamase superfamily II)